MSENETPEHETVEGRNIVGENVENIEAYAGVDPMYQAYANETEKPHHFTEEEIQRAKVAAGIPADKQSHFSLILLGEDGEPVDDEEGEPAPDAKTAPAKATPPPVTATIPAQAKSPETKAK